VSCEKTRFGPESRAKAPVFLSSQILINTHEISLALPVCCAAVVLVVESHFGPLQKQVRSKKRVQARETPRGPSAVSLALRRRVITTIKINYGNYSDAYLVRQQRQRQVAKSLLLCWLSVCGLLERGP